MSAPHSCGRCEARWHGFRVAHCRACHRTFTTPANFDLHRSGSRGGHAQGDCSDPVDRGLIANGRGYWALPGRKAESS